jgi:glycogen(starch) synthase
MRILVLTNLYPPAALGGYERMCRDVVERFRRRGHTVGVLTSTFGGVGRDVDHDVRRRL